MDHFFPYGCPVVLETNVEGLPFLCGRTVSHCWGSAVLICFQASASWHVSHACVVPARHGFPCGRQCVSCGSLWPFQAYLALTERESGLSSGAGSWFVFIPWLSLYLMPWKFPGLSFLAVPPLLCDPRASLSRDTRSALPTELCRPFVWHLLCALQVPAPWLLWSWSSAVLSLGPTCHCSRELAAKEHLICFPFDMVWMFCLLQNSARAQSPVLGVVIV